MGEGDYTAIALPLKLFFDLCLRQSHQHNLIPDFASRQRKKSIEPKPFHNWQLPKEMERAKLAGLISNDSEINQYNIVSINSCDKAKSTQFQERSKSMITGTSRTVSVVVISAFHKINHGEPVYVNFSGTRFGELKERLAEVCLPGIGAGKSSFYTVCVEGRHLCLLDDEKLPEGDLYVDIHNYSDGEIP